MLEGRTSAKSELVLAEQGWNASFAATRPGLVVSKLLKLFSFSVVSDSLGPHGL